MSERGINKTKILIAMADQLYGAEAAEAPLGECVTLQQNDYLSK